MQSAKQVMNIKEVFWENYSKLNSLATVIHMACLKK